MSCRFFPKKKTIPKIKSVVNHFRAFRVEKGSEKNRNVNKNIWRKWRVKNPCSQTNEQKLLQNTMLTPLFWK